MSTIEPLAVPEAFAPPAKIGPWSITPRNEFFSIVPMNMSVDREFLAGTKHGLLRSGGTWHAIPAPPRSLIYDRMYRLAVGPDASGPLYVLANRLSVSDSYGESWTQLRVPGNVPGPWAMLAASQKTEGKLYFANYRRDGRDKPGFTLSLWSTSDGGHTWDEPRPVSHVKPPNKCRPPPHPLLLDDDETVFMAAPEGLYRCGDEIVRLSHHTALDAMAVSTLSPQIATAGSLADGGGYHLQISKDQGTSWSTRDPYPCRFEVKDLLFAEDLLFARVGRWDPASGGKFAESILMTNDSGDNWIDVTSPPLAAVLAAGDGEKRNDFWLREGLSYGHGRLFLPDVLPSDLYSVELSELRKFASDQ